MKSLLFRIACLISIVLITIFFCMNAIDIKFDSRPCLNPTEDGYFTLCEPMFIHYGLKTHVIPYGFKTDLASVPRFLWPLYAPTDSDTIAPAILHDYLYSCEADVSRVEADNMLYSALIASHLSHYTAFKYWLAVRLFGVHHFHEGHTC